MSYQRAQGHRPRHRRLVGHRRGLCRPAGAARLRPDPGRPQRASASTRWPSGSTERPAARSRPSPPISTTRPISPGSRRCCAPIASITLLVNNAGFGAHRAAARLRHRQDGGDDRAERHRADAADLCGGARLRRARRRHDHQHRLDRRDRARSCSTASMAAARPSCWPSASRCSMNSATRACASRPCCRARPRPSSGTFAACRSATAAEIVMSADDMVDAALAGLDRGETVTIPALPDAARVGCAMRPRAAPCPASFRMPSPPHGTVRRNECSQGDPS